MIVRNLFADAPEFRICRVCGKFPCVDSPDLGVLLGDPVQKKEAETGEAPVASPAIGLSEAIATEDRITIPPRGTRLPDRAKLESPSGSQVDE